jgi:hypothetical protein
MEKNFQQALLKELMLLLDPLVAASTDPEHLFDLLRWVGWDVETLLGQNSHQLFLSKIDAIVTAFEDIEAWVTGTKEPESLSDILTALDNMSAAVKAIHDIPTTLTLGGAQPPELNQLPAELINKLCLLYMLRRAPSVYHLLILLGVITEDTGSYITHNNAIVRFPAALPFSLHLDRLPGLLSDPLGWLKQEYLPSGISTATEANQAGKKLFSRLAAAMSSFGAEALAGSGVAPVSLDAVNEEALNGMMTFTRNIMTANRTDAILGVTLGLVSEDQGGPGLFVKPFGVTEASFSFERWDLRYQIAATIDAAQVTKSGLKLLSASSATRFDALTTLSRRADSESGQAFLVGSTTGTRLEIDRFAITGEANLENTSRDFGVLVEVGSAAIVVSAGEGDGFLQKVLPKDGFRTDFDLGIGWSNKKGLYFRGSASLEATLAVHADLLGVLEVDSVYLALQAKNSDINIAVATTASIKLGPFIANVERIGLLAKFTFPEGGGNLGPANVELGFKPPDGAGMVIDGSVIVGGGYLFFDPANEQYAGVLQLEIQDVLSIKAIGLLTTRMPDGSKGFSLLIIITAQFPPIQLGFGFSLNGLGGLLGVNRTMELDVLRAGVKNRTLDSIMFPENPVANASRIISDLQSVFPPVSGRFVFGPMAELSWGKPATILTIQLGIVLEVPSPVRLAIMGKLTLVLPTLEVPEEAQIIVLHLDVLGTIDFGTGDAGIDATLYDSRIATFPITGDMAMRLNWGASPMFALSVGGFNPRFQPPPNFPSLDRLAIVLSTSDNPRIRLEAYLAMTTNTMQLGARLDVYAEADLGWPLGVFRASAYLGFDALVYLSPLSFIVDIEGYVCVKGAGQTISAWLYLCLSGPQPWHAYGEAIVEFLGKHHIPIDLKVGEEEPPPPLPPGDPLAELRTAVADTRNWSAQLPGDGHMLVTLRNIPISENSPQVLMHPFGELSFRQKVVPLDTVISKYGSTTPINPGPFTIAKVTFNGQSTEATRQTVRDLFAPGQFFELSDEEKLSRPSFESLPSGCTRISTSDISHSDKKVLAEFQYDTVVIDNREELISRRGNEFEYSIAEEVVLGVASLGAAGQSAMQSTGGAKFAGSTLNRVGVQDAEYVVATKEDMKSEASALSYTEAEAARRSKDVTSVHYQVVGKHEVS